MSNPYMRDALMDEMEGALAGAPQAEKVKKPYQPDPVMASIQSQMSSGASSGGGGGIARDAPSTPDAPDSGGGGNPEVSTSPGQRMNPWDDPMSSKYAPRIVDENGQSYLTEHGNRRLLQGQEVADATAYRDSFWAQNPTGFQAGVGPQRNEDYLPPSQGSGGGSGGTSSAPLGSSGATAGRYAGFDTGRAQDPSKSAKDAFLRAATASGSMPSTKEEAEAWFNQYVKQALIDAGYQVDWVQGDKAFVRTRENPGGEEIDFLQNAGGDNPMLAWQSNMAGQNTAGAGGGGTASSTGGAASALTSSDANKNINAAIQALIGSGWSMEDIMKYLESGGKVTPTPQAGFNAGA